MLALGKLGGREMTAGSDLDLMVIYDSMRPNGVRRRAEAAGFSILRGSPNASSTRDQCGPTMASCITSTCGLRPSGNSGPVATSLEAFDIYQRARSLDLGADGADAGEGGFCIAGLRRADREDHRRCAAPSARRRRYCGDIVEMRRAVASERGDAEHWEDQGCRGRSARYRVSGSVSATRSRQGPSRDLQTAPSCRLKKAASLNLLAPDDAELLLARRLYHELTQILRLCVSDEFDPAASSAGLLRLLARAADLPNFVTLNQHLIDTQKRVRACCERLLNGRCRTRNFCGFRRRRWSFRRSAGSMACARRPMVPTPTLERMRIDPPCRLTSDFAMARPSPEPG